MDYPIIAEESPGTEPLASFAVEPCGELVRALGDRLGIPARKHESGRVVIAGRAEASFMIEFGESGYRALEEVNEFEVKVPEGRQPAVAAAPLGFVKIAYSLETPYKISFITRETLRRNRMGFVSRLLDRIFPQGTPDPKVYGYRIKTGQQEMDRLLDVWSMRPEETIARLDTNKLQDDIVQTLMSNAPFLSTILLESGRVEWSTFITDRTTVNSIHGVLKFLPGLRHSLYGL